MGDADSPALVAVWPNGGDQRDGLQTALVVDRRVRHLETQLFVNRRRRAFFARIFGLEDDYVNESRTHGRRARSSQLHPGNEYYDERCRLRMLHAGEDLNLPPLSSPVQATSVASSTSVEPQRDDSEPGESQTPQSDNQTTTLPPAVEST